MLRRSNGERVGPANTSVPGLLSRQKTPLNWLLLTHNALPVSSLRSFSNPALPFSFSKPGHTPTAHVYMEHEKNSDNFLTEVFSSPFFSLSFIILHSIEARLAPLP